MTRLNTDGGRLYMMYVQQGDWSRCKVSHVLLLFHQLCGLSTLQWMRYFYYLCGGCGTFSIFPVDALLFPLFRWTRHCVCGGTLPLFYSFTFVVDITVQTEGRLSRLYLPWSTIMNVVLFLYSYRVLTVRYFSNLSLSGVLFLLFVVRFLHDRCGYHGDPQLHGLNVL
jgi:hypothetical protein